MNLGFATEKSVSLCQESKTCKKWKLYPSFFFADKIENLNMYERIPKYTIPFQRFVMWYLFILPLSFPAQLSALPSFSGWGSLVISWSRHLQNVTDITWNIYHWKDTGKTRFLRYITRSIFLRWKVWYSCQRCERSSSNQWSPSITNLSHHWIIKTDLSLPSTYLVFPHWQWLLVH